jgi:beta-aspartyl-dipeptidase (metallo-type)
MITLIRGGAVYAPEPLGRKDILILDKTIGAVAEPGSLKLGGVDVEEIDASGKSVLPGFIDPHVHMLGGGGEGGPATRSPEIDLEDIIPSGVTTLIGCLGTDSVTRHMTSLLAKARALEVEGLTTFIFSGSYEIPVKTITGSVRSDLILIDKVIGAGEIALSDHRSSQPTFEDFCKLAAECRVGGLLGGKPGILMCHLGDGPRRLDMIFRLVKETEIPVSQVIPTHVNRNRSLFEHGLEFLKAGGAIDLTADTAPEDEHDVELSVETSIGMIKKAGLQFDKVTVSSDSNGSLPVFGPKGELLGLTVATEQSLLRTFRSLIARKILTIEEAARLFAANPASFYRMAAKGAIKARADADILVFDDKLNLTDVFALGRKMMAGGRLLAHGTFRAPENKV